LIIFVIVTHKPSKIATLSYLQKLFIDSKNTKIWLDKHFARISKFSSISECIFKLFKKEAKKVTKAFHVDFK